MLPTVSAPEGLAILDDLGPLAWVLDELRKSLEGATKADKDFLESADTKKFFGLTDNAEKNVLKITEMLSQNHIQIDIFDADHNGHINSPELTAAMKAAMKVLDAQQSAKVAKVPAH